MTRLTSLASALLLAPLACGGDEPAPSASSSGTFSASSSTSSGASGPVAKKTTVSSCDLSKDLGYCLDFAIGAPADEASNNCLGMNITGESNGITNETTACPAANRVATCVTTPTSGVKTTYRYFPPKFTAASAETNCKTLPFGTFTAN